MTLSIRHRWLLRLAALVAMLAVYFLQNLIFSKLQQHYQAPVTMQFQLPLSNEIAAQYGISTRPAIDKVVVTGFFADWREDSPYQLQQQSDSLWQLQLSLPPGANQYKFVLYLAGQPQPLWLEDQHNPHKVQGAWQGYNSVLTIPDIAYYQFIGNTLVLTLLALLLLYLLLQPLMLYIMRLAIAFRFKLMLSSIILIILSNLTFIGYQWYESRKLVQQGVIDSLNMLHLALAGAGVQFDRLDQQQATLQAALLNVFRSANTRVEKSQHSPYQITLSDIAILDQQFQLVYLSHRNQNHNLQHSRALRHGFANATEYFMQAVLAPAINKARQQPQPQVMFAAMPPELSNLEPLATRQGHFFLGFNTVIKPIFEQGQLVGYYAGAIQSKLYGAEIKRMLLVNLLLMLIISLFSLLLLARVGRLVSRYLIELVAWTRQVIHGDLQAKIQINSGDEIQLLAENFSAMRQSLRQSFREIDEKNQQLRRIAYTDALTGLPNRARLQQDLTDGDSQALILLNIDAFRGLNDFFGSQVGDSVLQQVAGRLQAACQPHLLYRTGPDEFVVRLQQLAADNAAGILQQLAQQLRHSMTSSSYTVQHNDIHISVSAGLALAGSDNALFSQAAIALQRARQTLQDQLLFEPQMEQAQEYEQNMLLARRLKQAIDEDRIVPYFQPVVANSNRQIQKYECLVRLLDTDGHILTPAQFLEIAKQARLYPQISQIMLRKAFAAFSQSQFQFSVNLSVEDILHQPTSQLLFELLQHDPDTASRVIFELTESAEIHNYQPVRDFIQQVKTFGCQIAIDDFGAGYSNFAHILSLNVDYLKIDGSLIRHLDSDANARLITGTIAGFAAKLGIKTIAEFVHSEPIYQLVQSYGIDYSQGYYFGPPAASLADQHI